VSKKTRIGDFSVKKGSLSGQESVSFKRIINGTAFPKLQDVNTSMTQAGDIKDSYEEIVDSLLLYLKQMGGGAIILADDKTNELTEEITRVEDRRNSNKRYSIRINNLGNPAALAIENILLHEKSRRTEEALENARNELERKVKERTSELMEANRKLTELSMTDGLTGLYNHRHFLRELESECRRALRYRRSLALLVLDVDHFKEVNDRYGHPCGDFVLKNLAGLLKGCIRSSDIAARCGGDELAIILPETNRSKASEVAEKLRRQ